MFFNIFDMYAIPPLVDTCVRSRRVSASLYLGVPSAPWTPSRWAHCSTQHSRQEMVIRRSLSRGSSASALQSDALACTCLLFNIIASCSPVWHLGTNLES